MERVNDTTFDRNTTTPTSAMDLELVQASSGPQEGQGRFTASQYYELMLETCERLFDNQVEQLAFEDQMREMFGLHVRSLFLCFLCGLSSEDGRMQDAYKVFTIDKVLATIIKHVNIHAASISPCAPDLT